MCCEINKLKIYFRLSRLSSIYIFNAIDVKHVTRTSTSRMNTFFAARSRGMFRRSEGIDRWPSWHSSVPRPPVRRSGYMAIRAGWHRLSNKLTSSHDIRPKPTLALHPINLADAGLRVCDLIATMHE